MKHYLRSIGGPILMLIVLGAALALLHRELRHYSLHDFAASLRAIPSRAIYTAAGLTVLSYTILVGYELLGIRYLQHALGLGQVALASLLGYALGYNLGPVLGGAAIRFRLYTAWGLSAVEITKLIFWLMLTFWCGVCLLGAVVFTVEPLPVPTHLHLPLVNTRPLGFLLLVLAVAYVTTCTAYHRPFRIAQWEFSPPPVRLAVMQFLVAGADLMVAALVLYVLLPPSQRVDYPQFLSIYLLAIITALVTQVPGGLGVLELVVLLLLQPVEPYRVVGSLLAFRAIYFLFPLSLALVFLTANEIALHRKHAGKLVNLLGQWSEFVVPRGLAVAVFLSGLVLLFSGATPAESARLTALRRFLPLPLIELSHFLASMVGILLILLARSLQRRVETAYYLTVALLVSGIAFSLLKAIGYEEALVLTAILLVFLPSRSHFYRTGALLSERFSFRWMVAVILVLLCTGWLMLFSYKHIQYRDEMWWQFATNASAPRSLRAMAGAVLVTLVVSLVQLLRSTPRLPAMPTPPDLEAARQIVQRSPRASSHLALLGDKRLLFNARRTALIMYGIEGRSWVCMGDPIGEAKAARELAWNFREICDQGDRWPVFYQVDEDRVAMYVEMGLTLIKLGEQARVSLPGFGLEGAGRRNLRYTHRHLTSQGCQFQVVEPPIGDELMGRLKVISDAWLAEKNAAEKGFSLGFFNPHFLRYCPIAVVRRQGECIAFANVWQGADKVEMSLDLMRYLPESPPSVMEYLFIESMLWAKGCGFQWFDLGMAPLSGVEAQPLGPLWNRVAALAFRHGENLYNFQGLRQYKEKFAPVWHPRYLAAPSTFALPVILTNVASLISGGLRELVTK